jgi:2-succinyl-5-enolpyruvyl-6-hydroxy-3-cyclohexene-1-carboxylate synthase
VTPENLLTAWATLLIDSLATAGVTDVVISPGSRSTPFVLAAAANPHLRCHDAIDERAAAFFALGQARVTGRPTVLLCTSGTAGAHYLPAVIEAAHAAVPLVIVTADRPPELHHAGANQTIAQLPLYAGYARHVVDLGTPDASPAALRGLRRAALQAVALASAPVPGPVHVNAPARKPLEPRAATTPEGRALDAQVAALVASPATRVTPALAAPDPAAIDELARLVLRARRGVIVAGPAPVAHAATRPGVAALAAATGFPLLAEAASQLRFTGDTISRLVGDALVRADAFDWLYRASAGRRELAPDLIVQLGAAPTSAGLERLLDERSDTRRVVLAAHGWPDPSGGAAHIVHGDPAASLEALADAVARLRGAARPEPSPFSRALAGADARAWRVIDADIAATAPALDEHAVARLTTAALPPGSYLAIGNSLPIRAVDGACPGPLVDARVLSQRGASGIDGLVAGAAGAASATDRAVTLLVGDVSFLHDLGGLMLARPSRAPLVVVVINNDGGRIFETLPLAQAGQAAAMPHFTTPHGLDLAHAARLFDHAHVRAGSRAELARALAEAHVRAGCTIVEAVVPPRAAAAAQARIDAALAGTLA